MKPYLLIFRCVGCYEQHTTIMAANPAQARAKLSEQVGDKLAGITGVYMQVD